MFNEKLLSNAYNVRMLTADDIDEIYKLCCKNPLFYEYHPPFVTYDSILEDMSALPLNKTMDDKYYIGFFSDEGLVAIMDLIIGYPKEDIAFIGFFMTDKSIQSKGVGSSIISDCIAYLKDCSFEKVRLGVDKGNPQSFHFWTKNAFLVDETCDGEYIVMERNL